MIPRGAALRLLELRSHAEPHVVGERGHWTQIEHAGTFNRLVGGFLAGA